jgi:hypothetical protein
MWISLISSPKRPGIQGPLVFAGERDQEPDTELICIDCLLDEHPGQPLEYARANGEWIAT